MHYRLGQQLFLEYWSRLFGNNMVYNQSNFYVKSTNVNRTIESVQSQLFGILENLTPLNLSIFEVQYAQPPWSKNIYAYEGIISTYTGPVFEGGPKYHPIPVHVENGGMNPYDRGDFLRTYSP